MRTRKVLLVDDDPGDRRLTRRGLERLDELVEIRCAHDGQEALDLLEEDQGSAGAGPDPDLVLLDLHLPRVSGKGVLEALQRQKRPIHPPIVVLSSSQRLQDRTECAALGAAAFYTKPERAHDLFRLVAEIHLRFLSS